MKKEKVFFIAAFFLVVVILMAFLSLLFLDYFPITGQATSGPSRFLWKPVSESDGHLAVLVSGCSGASLYTLDGDLIERGSSRGASNGYSDTIRFKKSGGSYPDRIVVHTCGGRCYIKDTSSRITSCARPPASSPSTPSIPSIPSIIINNTTITGQAVATTAYEEKVFYGSDPRQFYILRILPEHQNSKKINIGFYNHGGGWVDSTTYDQFASTASYFETQGYSTVNIEYRNCNSNLKFPVSVEDVALGVNHAVAKLKSMGYQIQDTFWIGHSAGGINGALLLYSNNYPNITEVDKFISLGSLYRVESIRPHSLDSIMAVSGFEPSKHLIFHGKTHVPALLVQGYGMTNSRGITGDAYDIYGQISESTNPNSHINFFANHLRSYGIPAETYALIPGHHGTPIIQIDARNSNYLAVLNAFLKKDFCGTPGACPYPPGSSSSSVIFSKSGIIIPLYLEDSSAYSRIVQARNSYPNVPIVVIINPDSGPSIAQDSQYVSWISQLQASGVIVVGYVYTGYGSRNVNVVKADIDKYKQFYPSLNGIFYDEMSNQAGSESYYQSIILYSNTKGFSFSVGNPGVHTISSYINLMNITLIYEDDGLPALSQYSSYNSYDNLKLGMIPLNVPVYSEQWVNDSLNIIGWLYVTDDKLDNPWDTLSSHFEKTVLTLNKVNSISVNATANKTSPLRNCTSSDWSSSPSSLTCPREGYITITWSKMANCLGGVNYPASEQKNCVYNPTWEEKDDDNDKVSNGYDRCSETAAGLKVNPKGCPLPELGGFKSSFLGTSDLNQVKNFELKSTLGNIKFNSPVSLVRYGDRLSIGNYVRVEQNKIIVDSGNLPELNVPATLVFNNVSLTSPVVLRDGVLCGDCILQYVNGIAVVTVSGFSTYELVEQSYYDNYINQVTTPVDTNISSCVEFWVCSNWTDCENGNQIRECIDGNSCNTSSGKPSESQSCSLPNELVCTPNWQCSEWSPEVCPENQKQTRACLDTNNCYVVSGKPEEEKTCDFYEEESNLGIVIIIIALILLIAGGIFYYFKFIKGKKENTNRNNSNNNLSENPNRGFNRGSNIPPNKSFNPNGFKKF